MSGSHELTAIIVSWNACEELKRCLESLRRSDGVLLTTIVVDNASAEGNAAMVKNDFPEATLITNDRNRGFAAAVNQGVARAHGDVVLINPDLEVEPPTLAKLHESFGRYPSVGIVGPQLRYPNGSIQPSVKRFPDWFDLFLILSKVPNFFPGLTRRYNGLDRNYEKEQIVDQVMGSCFMIRRKTLEDVGAFDEGFWMWFEEVDFCKRAKRQGWLTLFTPAARAVHARGASFSRASATEKQRALRNSIVHYSMKYFGKFKTRLLAPAELMSIVSGMLIDALNLSKPSRAKDL